LDWLRWSLRTVNSLCYLITVNFVMHV